MEFRKGSIITTKDGEYFLKRLKTLYNAFTFEPVVVCVVDDNGNDKSIEECDVITVKNNHLGNFEEP